MKHEYDIIYEQLYDFYEESNLFYKINPDYSKVLKNIYFEFREYNLRRELFVERIKRNITDFEFENRFPLRSDSKFFLTSTFDNMIIKPILRYYLDNQHKENSDYSDFEKEMFVIIDHDIKLILSNSLQHRKSDEKISGHEILRSVDRLWNEMKASKIEIWG